MAVLNLRDFVTIVQTQAAGVQASARALLDLTVGSTLRAILEANASVALWMQWLILQVLALTRAATSNGADLDTWMADFGLVRQAATLATGTVTFSRLSLPGQVALILPGATVRTADGLQTFAVTTDTTNAAWSISLGGYTLGASAASVIVPVQSINAGIQGNVMAGTITLLATAIPGVDLVTNVAAFTNALAAETDPALRARFANFLSSRARATVTAVGYAVSSVQQGLSYSIVENQTAGGGYQPGNFLVYVDDGSGAPPSSLLTAVYLAVDAYRPLGSSFAVFGPIVVTANIAFTITAAPGYVYSAMYGPAALAVSTFVNALPMGSPLPFSRIAQIVFDSSPGITNVSSIAINGGSADLGGTPGVVVRAGTVIAS